ncbi:DNA circularization N-terminal domain-containing protein [Rhizobium sp. 18055]|uniref:DNA circularization N-terminal domain-containing protein n=1 Tax=Rhizobium sp. 18055 TaxID=2681403 RepID=UPI001356F0A7|nr:DNA circularization N-terminal domain-containing protein [Rhizobium sp. 18055]
MQLDSISWVLPGLLPGSFRGIVFHVPDATSDVGRRVVEYLFPGVDAADYDDFGLAPGVVSFSGLIVGDDYRVQAMALQAAFEAPGPATLIHPWLGPMTVIMTEPAQIYFSDRELRVVRFSASFKRIDAGVLGAVAGLSGLTSAISGVVQAATSLAAAVGGIISSVRSLSAARSYRVVSSAIAALTAPAGTARLLPRLKATIGDASPADPLAFDALMQTASALVNSDNATPAVSPAAGAVIDDRPLALPAIGMALTLVEQLSAASLDAPADADRALLLTASAQFLGQLAAQSAFADYASRQEAQAVRARITVAIEALCDALDQFSGSTFDAASTVLRRSARDLQSAIIADINETIGRLPAVLVFRADRQLDAWLLAQHVFGDTPQLIEAGYRDIVARNNPRHPSALPAGGIEVLG